jgi:hypothetical protein
MPGFLTGYVEMSNCRRSTKCLQRFKWSSGEDLLKQYDDRDTETGEVVHIARSAAIAVLPC